MADGEPRFAVEEQNEGWYIRDRRDDTYVSTDPMRWKPNALDVAQKLNAVAREAAHA